MHLKGRGRGLIWGPDSNPKPASVGFFGGQSGTLTRIRVLRFSALTIILQCPIHIRIAPTLHNIRIFFSYGSTAPWGPRPPHFSRFHHHTLFRHTTFGRTPLDEGPARRRDLYLTTHNTHNRQTSSPLWDFFFFCLSGVFSL
jgi:hypothetical protein